MITYKEVLGIIKQATAPKYDLNNPSVVRALRARQRALKQRGQNTAELDRILAKVPFPQALPQPLYIDQNSPQGRKLLEQQERAYAAQLNSGIPYALMDRQRPVLSLRDRLRQHEAQAQARGYGAVRPPKAKSVEPWLNPYSQSQLKSINAMQLYNHNRLPNRLSRALADVKLGFRNLLGGTATNPGIKDLPSMFINGLRSGHDNTYQAPYIQAVNTVNSQTASALPAPGSQKQAPIKTTSQTAPVTSPASAVPTAVTQTSASQQEPAAEGAVNSIIQPETFQGGSQQSIRNQLGIKQLQPNKGRITYVGPNGQSHTYTKTYDTPVVGKHRMKQVAPGVWVPDGKAPVQQASSEPVQKAAPRSTSSPTKFQQPTVV